MKRYLYKATRQTFGIGVGSFSFQGGELLGTSLHSHRYEELHLLTSGTAEYTVGAQQFVLHAGDLIYIPRHVCHSLQPAAPNTCFYVFDGTVELDGVRMVRIPPAVLEELCRTGKLAQQQEDPSLLSPWVMYLLGLLNPQAFVRVEERSDDAVVLMQFIAENYHRDITLADAAKAANISQRQAQRLFKLTHDRTFLQELTAQRMAVATYLRRHTDMPLEDISGYVGYQSYSGFWKAWRNYKKAENIQER